MTRSTTIALAMAFAAHAAVMFGVPLRRESPLPLSPKDVFEVTLYEPPPPALNGPSDTVPAPDSTPPAATSSPSEAAVSVTGPPPHDEATVAPVLDQSETPPDPSPAVPPDAPVDPIRAKPPAPTPKARAASSLPARLPIQRAPTGDARPASPQHTGSGPATPSAGAAALGYQNVGSVSYLRRGRASYPPEALRKKQSGTVMLTLYINERGTVDRVEIARSSGNALLDAAAVKAESKSKFRPPVINGRPAKCKARVPYVFEIR